MSKKEFTIRLILWILFACLLPVGFICWRYNLFTKIDRISFSGWGILGIIILAVFIYVLIKYLRSGLTEYSMFKQVLNGITKVILPLSIVLGVSVAIRNSLDYFIQSLCATIVCEIIAIPINPFPKWVQEKSDGKYENMMDILVNKLNKKEEEKK